MIAGALNRPSFQTFDEEMKIIRTGLIAALLIEVVTIVVGVIQRPHYVHGLGIFDYLMYPGIIIGWLAIWGDGPEYQRSIEIGLAAAVNTMVVFIVTIGLLGAWRFLVQRTRRLRNK